MIHRSLAESSARRPDANVGDVALLTAASAALALASAAVSGLQFIHSGDFLGPVGGVVVFLGLINLYQRVRLPENTRLMFMLNILMIYFSVSLILLVYQYAMALLPAYPISRLIHDADALVGFEWIKFSIIVHKIPYLSETLGFCYKNWMREIFLVVMILTYRGKFDRLKEFSVAYILTGMAAITVSGLLYSQSYDALIAYSTPGAHLPTGFTQEVFDKAERLRQGRDHTLDFSRLVGLICFPSFHAGAAVLLATAMRGMRWLSPFFLTFNVLVLLGTLTEGGHNLTDVIGGCLIAIAAAGLAQAYLRWDLARRLMASAGRLRFGQRLAVQRFTTGARL
jgi:membrane-associated phospholipid phosphatase